MRSILIVGGGFAGVWSAMAAARAREDAGAREVVIRLVSRDPWLTIRPRLYESDLSNVRVPLDDVLGPIGVERVEANVTGIDVGSRTVALESGSVERWDRLVLAAGSALHRPDVPGLREHAFSVDTYGEAAALARHLRTLPRRTGPGTLTAVVVGSGFTGIEVATELIGRLEALAAAGSLAGRDPRVVLIERAATLAPGLGAAPRPVIEDALAALGIEHRVGQAVVRLGPHGVRLASGERIAADTIIWTGGFCASALTRLLPVRLDDLGRVPVDQNLAINGIAGAYAAGDVARALAEEGHPTLMSCQHAIPMGMVAGHNAVASLTGRSQVTYAQPGYVTCLDLGGWGAVFTQGWDREVRLVGPWAKVLKESINRRLIYPPRSSDRQEILEAVAPTRPVLAA